MLYNGWIHKPYSMIWTERTWGGERGPGGSDWNEWRMNGWTEEGEQGGPREEGSVVLSGPALSGRPLVQIYTSDPDAFISAQRERRSHAAGRGYTERKQAVRGSNRQRWPANTRGGEAGGCHSVNTTQSTEAMMCSLWGGEVRLGVSVLGFFSAPSWRGSRLRTSGQRTTMRPNGKCPGKSCVVLKTLSKLSKTTQYSLVFSK